MKLFIKRSAYDRIRAFTDLCTTEISGLGKVEVTKDEDLIVTQVEIFDQEVSGAHSTIETAALAKFQSDRVQAGESMKGWTLWWHSHADMDTFFSGTDTGTIESSRELPYLISLVVNKAGKSEARLDVFNPVHIFIGLEVEVLGEVSDDVKQVCQSEIDMKVKRPTPKHPYSDDWRTGFSPLKRSVNVSEMDDAALAKWLREGDDSFEEAEYWAHKVHLKQEIEKLKPSRKAKAQRRLETLKKQLAEHLTWGRSAGYETLLITNGSETSSILPDIPTRE